MSIFTFFNFFDYLFLFFLMFLNASIFHFVFLRFFSPTDMRGSRED